MFLQKLGMMANRQQLMLVNARMFTGKTESGFKFRTPKMRLKTVKPIFPPPGLSLKPPEDMTPQVFCRQIGGDCEEIYDKLRGLAFETQ